MVLCRGAENCIVIAEGELDHRGVFRATALGMPPVESREDSLAATKASIEYAVTALQLHVLQPVLVSLDRAQISLLLLQLNHAYIEGLRHMKLTIHALRIWSSCLCT